MIHQNQDPGQGLCEFLPVPGPDFQERNSVLPEYYQKPNEELPVDLMHAGRRRPRATLLCFCRGDCHLHPPVQPLHQEVPLRPARYYQLPEPKQWCKGFLAVLGHCSFWKSWGHTLMMSIWTMGQSIGRQSWRGLRNCPTSRILFQVSQLQWSPYLREKKGGMLIPLVCFFSQASGSFLFFF